MPRSRTDEGGRASRGAARNPNMNGANGHSHAQGHGQGQAPGHSQGHAQAHAQGYANGNGNVNGQGNAYNNANSNGRNSANQNAYNNTNNVQYDNNGQGYGQFPANGHGHGHQTGQRSSSNSKYCASEGCGQPVTWRNVDYIGGMVPVQGGNGSNSNNRNDNNMVGPKVQYHANYGAREIQMKVLDILASSGLPQEDIRLLSGQLPAFASLPPDPGAQQSSSSVAWQDSPLQHSVAWLCAEFDTKRERREWFFSKREAHLPKIPSKYCQRHTCRHFFSEDYCAHQRFESFPSCNYHISCPAFGCQACKISYHDPNNVSKDACKFRMNEFCGKHKCEVDGCELLRDEVKQNQLGKFCPRHKCHYAGCVLLAQDHRGYCNKHKCQATNCQRIAGVGYMLCKKHIECGERGCAQSRLVVPINRPIDEKDLGECSIERYERESLLTHYLAYCKDHGICANSSCSKFRITASVHCRKHACLERGCNKPCLTNLKYCETHRCKMGGCMSPKGWNVANPKNRDEHCSFHTCREVDCLRPVDNLHIYCPEHKCSTPTCNEKVAEDNLCIEHFKGQHKKKTKAAVRRDEEESKIAGQRDAQQWASTFGVSGGDVSVAGSQYSSPYGGGIGIGSNNGRGRNYRHPLHYFPGSSRSVRSNMSRFGGGSPPRQWHQDHDRDFDADADGDVFDDWNNRGSHQNDNNRVHTPSSSDNGRSRFHGQNNDRDNGDDDDGDFVDLMKNQQRQQQQQRPQMPQQMPQQGRPPQQHPQQQPGIVRPMPQGPPRPGPGVPGQGGPGGPGGPGRSNGPMGPNSNNQFVHLSRGAPGPGRNGNEPIIHQRHEEVSDEDDY